MDDVGFVVDEEAIIGGAAVYSHLISLRSLVYEELKGTCQQMYLSPPERMAEEEAEVPLSPIRNGLLNHSRIRVVLPRACFVFSATIVFQSGSRVTGHAISDCYLSSSNTCVWPSLLRSQEASAEPTGSEGVFWASLDVDEAGDPDLAKSPGTEKRMFRLKQCDIESRAGRV